MSPGAAPSRALIRRVARGMTLVVVASIWFWIAGRWTWMQGWALLVAFVANSNALAFWLARSNPALLGERNRRAEDAESWDRIIQRCHNILMASLLVVAALDSGRFGWSVVPIGVQLVAWVCLCIAAVTIWHVMAVNTYASTIVRIQKDRGHVVVTKGLYGLVRHPMYVAVMLSVVCMPLVLGSLWGMIPGIMVVMLFVYRTAREDRTLMEKLSGYRTYAERVRYRLLPGLW